MSAPKTGLSAEQIAAIKTQMAAPPPPPAFVLALSPEQQAELKEWLGKILNRPSPADMFAKLSQGMIDAGIAEAQEFENDARQALAVIANTVERIESKVNLISGHVASK